MSSKRNINLTEGNIYYQIILFTMPILAGKLFQNLYNSVDSIVVGQFVGKTALAAVSSSSDISMLLTGFFTGLSVGASIVFSRYFGAKKYQELNDSIHTALLFSLILGFTMAFLGVVLSPTLLRIVGCPSDVFAEANSYLKIYFVGVLFTSLYNVGSGILRSVGDSRSPFIYLVIASIVNIILDIVFVRFMLLGVTGAALATVFSQSLSFILVCGRLLFTKEIYQVNISKLKIHKQLLGEIIVLGIPAAIQSSLISISNLFVQRYTNSFGSTAMAGIGAARKVDRFIGMIGQSIGLASATFVSQNVGSNNYKRAFEGVKVCLVLSFGTFAITSGIALLFSRECIALFTNDVEAIKFGVDMMLVTVPCYIFQSLNQIYSNVTRGFGKSSAVMFLSLLGMIVIRQLFLWVSMSYANSIWNVYVCYPVGWFFSALFVYVYYLFKIKLPFKKYSKC